MRLIPVVHFSFLDHPFRKPSFVVYFCGCPHRCKGCHSPDLQDPDYELCQDFSAEKLASLIVNYHERVSGSVKSLVLLGGDPVIYSEELEKALELLKESIPSLEVVLYTGFLFEEVSDGLKEKVDVIVDGKYREDLRTGKFPASSNQRVWMKENGKWKDITSRFLGKDVNEEETDVQF